MVAALDEVGESMAPAATPAEGAPLGTPMLYGFWYRAARSSTIRARKLTTTVMLETKIVLGRDRSGRAFAMRDACPHRGMPLSYGWFDGENVQCAYHGWKFDVRTGQCRGIPSRAEGQELEFEKIYAPHLACEERDGYVWVFLPDPSRPLVRSAGTPPGPAPALAVHSPKYRSFLLTSLVPIHADHALTSLMDPCHGPFVHAGWWWFARLLMHIRPDKGEGAAAVAREMERQFTPLPTGFRDTTTQAVTAAWFREHAGSDLTEVTADFVLPYHRLAEIKVGKYWLTGFASVTPITRGRRAASMRSSPGTSITGFRSRRRS